MSKFFSSKLSALQPYTPGEQPQDKKYVKLNTNENPYFPSRYAVESITKEQIQNVRLYSDPQCKVLTEAIAQVYGIDEDCILPTNGSDEALAFCFAAFGEGGVVFPDITYGFYPVFANFFGVNYRQIALDEQFCILPSDYYGAKKTVVLANPNAQTGIALSRGDIEKIIQANKSNVVVIDEAYVDFGAESCVPLIEKYDNLVVIQTFSKSRSLAGARVGFAVSCKNLTDDLKRVKYSFNPYNVNRLSLLLAAEAIKDKNYFEECRQKIMATRERLKNELKKRQFEVLPSSANFVLCKTNKMGGEELYLKLKEQGVLVRHFDDERIKEYVRITIGTDEQTDILLQKIDFILGGKA